MKRTRVAAAVMAIGFLGVASGCETEFVTPLHMSVLVEPQEADIVAGEEFQFTATVVDEFDQAVLGAVLTWSTSDSSIVRVDPDGRVSGLQPGATLVQASFNGAAGSALMTVEPGLTCGRDALAGKKNEKGDKGKKKGHDDDDDDDDGDHDDDHDPRCSPTALTGA